MRKVALLAAALGVLALGVTATAYAVDAQEGLSVSLQSNKAGTKKKPRSVGKFTVTTTTTPAPGTTPNYATTTAVIHFDKNIVFQGAKFPACTLTQAQQHSAKCNAAKVGSGTAKAVVAALGLNPTLTVTAYNGPRGKSFWLRAQEQSLNIDAILQGTLAKDKGKFGSKLIVKIPQNLQQPVPNVYSTLTLFLTTINRTYKHVPYIGLTGCTGGKLNFGGDFTFTDGSVLHATSTAKCRK
jgi:hypothetical protein